MKRKRENVEEKSLKIKSNKDRICSNIKNILIVSFSAQIMIMPIIAYTYKTISITFFITNILTSFLIGSIIIFGFLLVLISLVSLEMAKVLGNIYVVLIELFLFIIENTAKIPFSKIYIKSPYIFEIILYYIFLFIVLYLYKKLRKNTI
ncbi:MAG: hypothetical protein HFJ54_04025 [Clostridia bacterium]|nr:hypothetical protein [Clostridia bacterium]